MTRVRDVWFTQIETCSREKSGDGAAARRLADPARERLEEDLADLPRVGDLVRLSASRRGDLLQQREVAGGAELQDDQLHGAVRVEQLVQLADQHVRGQVALRVVHP